MRERKKEKEREVWRWCVFDIFPSSLTTSNWEQTTPTTTPVERFACVRKRVGEVRAGGKGGRACWREGDGGREKQWTGEGRKEEQGNVERGKRRRSR